jgi:hypothetical protein
MPGGRNEDGLDDSQERIIRKTAESRDERPGHHDTNKSATRVRRPAPDVGGRAMELVVHGDAADDRLGAVPYAVLGLT